MGDLVHPLHMQPPQSPRDFAPHEKVAGHAHQLVEGEILVDRANPRRGGIARRAKGHRCVLDINLAAGGLVNPRQDLNEGGFPSAVIPQQGVHLAGVHL